MPLAEQIRHQWPLTPRNHHYRHHRRLHRHRRRYFMCIKYLLFLSLIFGPRLTLPLAHTVSIALFVPLVTPTIHSIELHFGYDDLPLRYSLLVCRSRPCYCRQTIYWLRRFCLSAYVVLPHSCLVLGLHKYSRCP